MKVYELKPGDTAYLRVVDYDEHSVEYEPVTVARVLKTQIVLDDGRRYQREGGHCSYTRDNRVLHDGGLPVFDTWLVTEDDQGYRYSLRPKEWVETMRTAQGACELWSSDPDRPTARAAIAALEAWIKVDESAGQSIPVNEEN